MRDCCDFTKLAMEYRRGRRRRRDERMLIQKGEEKGWAWLFCLRFQAWIMFLFHELALVWLSQWLTGRRSFDNGAVKWQKARLGRKLGFALRSTGD